MIEAIARGSHGAVIFDSESGEVLEVIPEEDNEYENIGWINVFEWKGRYPYEVLIEVDILDLGYVRKDGEYVPPENEWRKEFRGKR